MSKGRKYTGGGAVGFLICLGFSAAALCLTSFIGALIAAGSDDPTGIIGICSLAAMIVAAIASGIFAARFKAGAGLGYYALAALTVVLVMLLINVIISAGRVSGASFMNYGCYMGAFLLFSYLGRKKDGHRRHRHSHS